MKHNPLQEYRDSTYRRRPDEAGPTRLVLPSRMVKAALSSVAKRVPGATAADIKQLCYVEDIFIDLYGVPKIFLAVARNADQNRTPDVKSRAIVPQWCCKVFVRHVMPQVSTDAVGGLMAAAGILYGLGDFRQEKGAGNFGQFELVNPKDKRVVALMKSGTMKAQDAALKSPLPYDEETSELLSWFNAEARRRDFKVVA